MARKGLRAEVSPFFGFNLDIATAVKGDTTSQMNQICTGTDNPHDACGVNMKFVCKSCGNDDRTTFKKGKIQDDGTVLLFDDSTLDEIKDATDAGNVLHISSHSIDEVNGKLLSSGKPYFTKPSTGSEKPWALFAKLVEKQEGSRVYLAQYAYSKVPRLYRFATFNGVLSLEPLCWPEDIAELPAVPDVDIPEKDLVQAEMLTEALAEDFNPDNYRDSRRERIAEMTAAATAVEGAVIEATGKSPVKPQVDMSGALEAALQAALEARGKAAKKAPAKKTAAKKATAKAS